MRILNTLKKAVVLVLATTALIACRKDDKSLLWNEDGSPIGTWSLSYWGEELSQPEIYLSFSDDGSFELYQRLYSIYFEYYNGYWELSDDVLSGTYSDGIEWRSSYYVAFRDSEMRFINIKDEDDVAYYVTSSIPDDVVELVNIGSKASEDSETSETGLLRNSGRFL